MTNNIPPRFEGTASFQISGMTCGHCAQAVTTKVSAVPGVETVEVDLSTGTVTVSVAQPVDRADVVAAVQEAGNTAST